MRNPDRISIICKKLEELWNQHPDQRLGQLLENYIFPNVLTINKVKTALTFFQEDDVTLENINNNIQVISDNSIAKEKLIIEEYFKTHSSSDIEELMLNTKISVQIIVKVIDELIKEGKLETSIDKV